MSVRRGTTVLLAAFLAGVAVAGCSSTGEPGHTSAIDVVPVDADGVAQTITRVSDSFDRVTVTTATYGRDGVDGQLQLSVAPVGPDGEARDARRAAAAGADIADNGPLTLTFEPFDPAAGDAFELVFTYAGEAPVALYRNPNDAYTGGELDAGGDLVFTLGHGDRVAGAVDALARAAREAGAIASADPAFLTAWLVALVALAVSGLRLRRPGGDRGAPSR